MSIFIPTRNIIVPRWSKGFIGGGTIGAIASSRRRSGGASLATATDTFNRADVNPMTTGTTMSDGISTWTVGPGAAPDVKIVSNNVVGAASYATCIVTSPSFTAHQLATLKLTFDTGVGPVVFGNTSDSICYSLYRSTSATLRVYRWSNTQGFTQIGSDITLSQTAGDTISLEASVSGSTVSLMAYKNYITGDSPAATVTDTSGSRITSGQPGLMAANNKVADDFYATDVA